MKKFILFCSTISLILGCQSSVNIATKSDALVITSVNASMTAWASYVNAGKATEQQITTVSNAYNTYYNAQLVASNAVTVYLINPTTNLQSMVMDATTAVANSKTNIVNIISSFTK